MADVRTQLFSLHHLIAVNYFTQEYNTDSEDFKSQLYNLASMVEVVSTFLKVHTADEEVSLATMREAAATMPEQMDNISSEADEIISIIQEWDVLPPSLMMISTTRGASITRGSDNTTTTSTDVSEVSSNTTESKGNTGSKDMGDPFLNTIIGVYRRIAPNGRYKPKHLRRKKFSIVPYEFASMWRSLPNLYEEKEMSSHKITRPKVAWHKVNPSALRRFTRPGMFPIMSVSPRPSFYGKSCDCATNPVFKTSVLATVHMLERRPGPARLCPCPTEFERDHPFGSLPGYRTNLGVVPIPDTPMFGHIWDHEVSDWVLHAEIPPSGPSPSFEVLQNHANQGYKDQQLTERRRTRGRPRRRG